MTLKMKQQRVKNANNTIIGLLNINSFRKKFVFAEEIIQVFVIFLVPESKLDNTFPTNLFKINGYKIFRYDRNRFGGGLFLYINERVPCRLLLGHPKFSNLNFPNFPYFPILVLEGYQNNETWLFVGVYNPPNQNHIEFLNKIGANARLLLTKIRQYHHHREF